MNTTTVFNICYVLPIFEDLAKSIHYSLIELGFTSHLSQSTIIVEATNILFGAHLIQDQSNILPNSIIFNLEQLDSNSRYCNEKYFNCLKTHTVWDYSQRNINYLKNNRINPNAMLVPIGYSPALNRISKAPIQDIDVLFYGAINERRQKILDGLTREGLNLVSVFGGVFGADLDSYISRSKTVINLHFHETKIFEVVRVSFLLNNQKVVISEVEPDTEIDPSIREAIIGVGYDKLVENTVRYVKNETLRLQAEETNFAIFSQRTQTAILRTIFELLDQKNKAPLFSVIIATHNRAKLLARAMQSIRAQTYQHIQLIIISDENNTQTYEVAAQGLNSGDIFIQRKGTSGPAESRNLGISQVNGDYFLFLDDDDTFESHFFSNLAHQLQQYAERFSNNHVFYTNFEVINELVEADTIIPSTIGLADIAPQDPDAIFVKNFIPNNCLIFPRRLANEIQFDTNLAYEDWDFILSACKKMPLKHLAITGPRIHKNQSATGEARGKSNDAALLDCYLIIYGKHPPPSEKIALMRKDFFSSINMDLDAMLKTDTH